MRVRRTSAYRKANTKVVLVRIRRFRVMRVTVGIICVREYGALDLSFGGPQLVIMHEVLQPRLHSVT